MEKLSKMPIPWIRPNGIENTADDIVILKRNYYTVHRNILKYEVPSDYRQQHEIERPKFEKLFPTVERTISFAPLINGILDY